MDITSQAMFKIHALEKAVIFTIIPSLFLACTTEKYVAKPINPQQTTAKILAKDPFSQEFKTYLIKQGHQENTLPFSSWGMPELIASALYHHAKLDVAKAQLALANAQLNTAGQKQNPILSGSLARSNQANGDIRPWAYGLNVEIPIETAGKRQVRIEEAQYLQEIAHLDVADAAWQLRSQIAKNLLSYHESMALQKLLQLQVNNNADIISMLEKRVAVGLMSNTEITASKLMIQTVKNNLMQEKAKNQAILANLAADAGLSLEKFSQIPIRPLDAEIALTQQTKSLATKAFKNLQEKALLNRLDIRRSLKKYAVAETKIKLEIAKQTPDISIAPGFIFDFGDKIWSLGFSSLINLLNKNTTLIAEATQLREIEGAQFEALQAKVIGDLNIASAHFFAAQQNLAIAKQQQVAQQNYLQKLNKQFAAGAIDRLELTQAAQLAQIVDVQVQASQYAVLNAVNALEDVMQSPLFDDSAILAN